MKITEKRLRSARWLIGHGIEIGALHNPLPVPVGAVVSYVDRLPVDALRQHYPELADEALVPIDFIGDAEDLSQIPDASQDFVIANHLLEHLENPLRGLVEMHRVLRPGGVLYVALPEPRITFDRKRELTTMEHVVAEFRDGTESTREAHYRDYVELAEPLNEFVADGVATGPARVRELADLSYSIHFHVWRPDTFLEVIAAARREGGVVLEPLEFSACRPGLDDEFIFVFAKGVGDLPPIPPREDPAHVERDRLYVEQDRLQIERGRVRAELARTQTTVVRARRQLEEAQRVIAAIEGSTTFRAAGAASRLARRLLPADSRRRGAAKRILGRPSKPAGSAGPAPPSPLDGPSAARAAEQRVVARGARQAQRFAVLILPRPGSDLDATLRSLHEQSWEEWQAVLLDPGTPSGPHAAAVAGERVRLHPGAGAEAINEVLTEIPRSQMVIFLEAGDSLAPGCLYELAACAQRDPLVDLVTWDDQIPGESGRHLATRLRPSWSPEMLLSADYLDRCFAIRASSAQDVGCVRAAAGTALLWDLILRCEFAPDRVARIPKVLTRSRRRSTRSPRDAVTVVEQTLKRRAWPATAGWAGDAVRVTWALPSWPRVSVIIPTRHNRGFMGPLLDGLARCDYPDLEVVVIDNGPRTPDNERWYGAHPLRPAVIWWDRPFNYSAVNNAGSRAATGAVLLFLNDDILVGSDPGWLKELVGWTTVNEVGSVGVQLVDPQGRIQHGGVIVGLSGFAGHLFAGERPRTSTLLGSTSWYRDVLAVTAACVAMRREDFEAVGGFDEAFTLCGSDVALGLSLGHRGLRSLCIPSNALTHLESATRGTSVPPSDYFASWWRYQRWIRSGDPYFHPRLSLQSTAPRLRRPGEPTAIEMVAPHLGRRLTVWHSQDDLGHAAELAGRCRIEPDGLAAVRTLHHSSAGAGAPKTVNWFIPGIDSPFYGGINTALRIAAKLAADHAVENRFVVCGQGPEEFIRSGISAAFPVLNRSPICMAEFDDQLADVPEADAAVATLWTTAYQVAVHAAARRKFYLVQDFEPMFYPAGTLYALAEESYRLGLYGMCNTENLARIYRSYGGTAWHFTPAVDPTVFHARGRVERAPTAPVTLFVYARPGHWRNCWELTQPALNELKDRLGDGIRIVAAGSWAETGDRLPSMIHLGLIDYVDTGELYRHCDMGLVLTVSEHPSYLPLELMACGAPVVAFDNPAGGWLLRDGVNCLLAPRTVDGLVDRLEAMAVDPELRRRLADQALRDIAARHSDWDAALSGVYAYMTDPERAAAADRLAPADLAGTHRADRQAAPPARHA